MALVKNNQNVECESDSMCLDCEKMRRENAKASGQEAAFLALFFTAPHESTIKEKSNFF